MQALFLNKNNIINNNKKRLSPKPAQKKPCGNSLQAGLIIMRV